MPPRPEFSPPTTSTPARAWLQQLLHAEGVTDPGLPHRSGTGAAERCAAERDVREGLLRRVVGDVVVAADVDLGPAGRAAALTLLLPPGAVALGGTAAWVHAGERLPEPRVLEVALAAPAARRLQRDGHLAGVPVTATRSVPPAADVVQVGLLAVTTAARTLLDVARTTPRRTAEVHRALLAAGLLDVQAPEEGLPVAQPPSAAPGPSRASARP